MSLSRRNFLSKIGTGVGAAAFSRAFPAFASRRSWDSSELLQAPGRAPRANAGILLNSNENAYGQFPSVQAAMRRGLSVANRYPFVPNDVFIDRIAAYHHVKPDQVVLGNGSTEILRIAAEAFTSVDKKLIMAHPTFESVGHYAQVRGTPIIQVPLTADYAHDLEAMLAKAESSTGLVYVCNPNNPTASVTPRDKIEKFIKSLPPNVYVLIDEAYHHFAAGPDYTSFIDRPITDNRVFVARTFSKIYGMAGLRLGYAIGDSSTIQTMRSLQLFDNANIIALQAGTAALNDDVAMKSTLARIIADRTEFLKQAEARGLKYISSRANFVMMETGRPIRQVIDYFHKHDIAIGRPFPPMDTYARISLGKPNEMLAFWKVWDEFSKAA